MEYGKQLLEFEIRNFNKVLDEADPHYKIRAGALLEVSKTRNGIKAFEILFRFLASLLKEDKHEKKTADILGSLIFDTIMKDEELQKYIIVTYGLDAIQERLGGLR